MRPSLHPRLLALTFIAATLLWPTVARADSFAGSAATGLDSFGARHHQIAIGRLTSVDPVLDAETALTNPQRGNRYAYALNRPLTYVDPDGRSPELVWDVLNIASGLTSLADNVRQGHFGWAVVDAAGIAVDSVAASVPFVPGGARTIMRAMRGADAARGGANSFSSLRRALGRAGEGKQWHHVVEQSKVGQFGSQAIHNADNVVSIPTDIHRKISGFYSSKQPFTGNQTVRQWLDGQSFEQQRAFGQQVLRKFGVRQ